MLYHHWYRSIRYRCPSELESLSELELDDDEELELDEDEDDELELELDDDEDEEDDEDEDELEDDDEEESLSSSDESFDQIPLCDVGALTISVGDLLVGLGVGSCVGFLVASSLIPRSFAMH